MTHQISIIIPTLNETDTIINLLNYLLQHASKDNILEIIVVDGGSTDKTQTLVSAYITDNQKTQKQLPNIILLPAAKGRAKQMNTGAKQATGQILYFLHADSRPPEKFDILIINEVKKGHQAGCFIMRFNSKHWWLKLAGQLTRLPWKSCRGSDQSLFITKILFNTIGGYDEQFTIYEDNDFIRKLYQLNQFTIIKKWLVTSPRHYNTNGIWRLQYHYWAIHLKKWLGASPVALNRYYLKHVRVKK